MSFSAHKNYGPKGIGAVYVGPRAKPHLKPILLGGGHEYGFRSGTINVPAIVGFGKCLELSSKDFVEENLRQEKLRKGLIDRLLQIPHTHLNGPRTNRLPGNANISFDFVKSTDLMMVVPQLALSSGSACGSGKTEPSRVILALGYEKDRAESSIRFGLGRSTTEPNIEQVHELINDSVTKLRAKSLAYEMFLQKGE